MTIRLVINDITNMRVDAIVNAANSELIPRGGVDGAIHQVAGVGLFTEVRSKHSFLPPGEAIITGGYHLPASHVIHTVAPRWIEGLENQVEILADCYRNSLRLADERGLKSIAFPSLGTGAFGIPREVAMPTALQAISLYLQNSHSDIEVVICCYSSEDYELYREVAQELGAVVGKNGEIVVEALLPPCPICFHQLKRIIYGFPSRDTLENQENIYIGGCIVSEHDPDLGCKNCDWRGFIADVNLAEGHYISIVVDADRNRFVAGVIYEAGKPNSAMGLEHRSPVYLAMPENWLAEQINKCQNPTFWLGKRHELLDGAFEKILLSYATLTKEVLEFAGFRQVRHVPDLD